MSPPVQPVASDEKLPASVDVVVIGAGIAGTTAAYELAKRDFSVALLDKGRVGGEQTQPQLGLGAPAASRPARAAARHEEPRDLARAQPGDRRRNGLPAAPACSMSRRGPADFAQWEAWTLKAREYQMHSRILSAAEAKELTPGSVPAWIGGVHSPTDGRGEPSLAGPAIAEAARRARRHDPSGLRRARARERRPARSRA